MLLGEIVTWDLPGKTVPFLDVKNALSSAGLSDDTLYELMQKSAFSRAVGELRKERAIDKVQVVGKTITFQFTHRMIEEGKADYQYECLVSLDTETGVVSCPESPEMESRVQDLMFQAHQTRTSQDITKLVQGMFQAHADLYPINPKKGVAYFVPEKHRDFTSKVERFLKILGGSLLRFPVPKGTEEGDASVREAVSEGLSTLISEIDQAVDSWDESTRKGTMDRTMQKYEQVELKLSAYSLYLQDKKEELEKVLEDRKSKLAKKIEEFFAAQN